MQEKTFRDKWLEAVEKKNSVLCAGLDPAEFGMGRKEAGLPPGVDKLTWACYYINAVAPYCAAIKPNMQYWKNAANTQMSSKGGMQSLLEINALANSLGLVVIEDSKSADTGLTNDAGMFYAKEKTADAVTFSPFAGNMKEAVQQAHSRGLGLISMVLMSNPGYEREKNKLVFLKKEEIKKYSAEQKIKTDRGIYVRQYSQLAHDANKFMADGI